MRNTKQTRQISADEVQIGNVIVYHGIRIAIDRIDVTPTEYGPCYVASGVVLNMADCMADETARWLLEHRSDAMRASGRESVQGTSLASFYVEI